jgi:hypothetical protein
MVDPHPQLQGDASPRDAGDPGAVVPPPVAHVADADDVPAWSSSPSELHLASGADSDGAAARDDEVSSLLRSADARDAAAGRRDLEARMLSFEDQALLAGVFRELAARDRDLAAGDRADLISLLAGHSPGDTERPG